ncbi:hypothetical protein [Nocardioides bruguierae]|uniref:hypothetical protein n=1 Tax=Nocardioides bruguierae TaxID=2945102 RepID=UPI002020B71F|nr:hypothetical protein [Nocardioides bruguierae]MCL8025915.1 hypothetical protein [Nocardioides bruguierae]
MTKPDARSTGTRWIRLVLLVVGAAVLLTLTSPLLDDDDVVRESDMASIDLGLPMPWLHQDQTGYDPSVLSSRGMVSPWENPTSASVGYFLADVALLFVVLLALTALLAVAIGRVRSSRGT